jgi:uncharacterized protein YndB with AHSA1/START domain
MTLHKHTTIAVQATVKVPVEAAWDYWTLPEHITGWYFASDDWHAPYAANDLRPKGKFTITMASKDANDGFDFEGVYLKVETYERIEYLIGGCRKVLVFFEEDGTETLITEVFEAEDVYTLDQQRNGWQAILDNFKKYAETKSLI